MGIPPEIVYYEAPLYVHLFSMVGSLALIGFDVDSTTLHAHWSAQGAT